VSKFHPFWCPVAQESKLEGSFWVGQTYPARLLDISAETGHIRSKVRHVYRGVSVATFIRYFGHILLTGCPIDHILFPLHS
jgi:hypothetical protein